MYSKEDHFLIKLLTNNAMQLEEKLKEQESTIENLIKTNTDLHKIYNILKDKYNNAIAMLHGTTPIKQEIVTQPKLFETLNKTNESTDIDQPIKIICHFKGRSLTTEQAQEAYNLHKSGNKQHEIVSLFRSRGIDVGQPTIHDIIYGNTYKEITRN